jgi:hypothetical protein
MKIFVGLLMFATLGVSAQVQDAKVIAELTASSEKVVKGSPFSADAVSESVQTLADGNRIVRSSTNKLYRNSEGRFRRDMGTGHGNAMGSLFSFGPGVTILDPVMGFRYQLDTNLKTAHQAILRPLTEKLTTGGALTAAGAPLNEEQRAKLLEKLGSLEKLNGEVRVATGSSPALIASTHGQLITGTGIGGSVIGFATGGPNKYESRTENLGRQSIEGVEAEGTRTITTIPAGAIGNERPIDIAYERWYSNELQLVVMSKHSDPRFGEQTYRLTNIVRSEPDPTLFSLPTGYRLLTESATPAYRLSTTKAEVEKAAAPKAAGQVEVTYVKAKP